MLSWLFRLSDNDVGRIAEAVGKNQSASIVEAFRLKFELLFGINCTDDKQRDECRAAFQRLLDLDFETLGSLLKLDPKRIVAAVEFYEGAKKIREEVHAAGRRRLIEWFFRGLAAAASAGFVYIASRWGVPK